MNDAKSAFIVSVFAWIPYAAVAWLYRILTAGDIKSFWHALGALVLARIFFWLIETIGGLFAWRIYGKKIMIAKFLTFLQSNHFPKREHSHDDMLAYIARIEDDVYVLPAVRSSAKELYSTLVLFEGMGILMGARMHSAADAALNIYSPKT